MNRDSLLSNPFEQFAEWFEEARKVSANDANAMALATADADGRPSVRFVLLKGFDEEGFIFFTDYRSRKGRELSQNPSASLAFYWPEINRQIRVSGLVSVLSRDLSEQYFRSRPRGSQIAAYASPQSSRVESREALDRLFEEVQQEFTSQEIRLPENWGGYLLKPDRFEFWQGREARLHDRFQYLLTSHSTWKLDRLAP